MITLKNKVKDMSQELKQKNQEIEFFKKNIKYTRFQELTVRDLSRTPSRFNIGHWRCLSILLTIG